MPFNLLFLTDDGATVSPLRTKKKGKETWSGLGLQQCQVRKELNRISNRGKDTIVTKKVCMFHL